MATIDDQLMDKLLHMARLELAEAQRLEMMNELNKMTTWLQKLSHVNVDNIQPLISMGQSYNRLREDTPQKPLQPSSALHNAPGRSSQYFRVPHGKSKHTP